MSNDYDSSIKEPMSKHSLDTLKLFNRNVLKVFTTISL